MLGTLKFVLEKMYRYGRSDLLIVKICFASFMYNIKTSFSAYREIEEGPIVVERKTLYFVIFSFSPHFTIILID